ncbi:MAG: hypothetical protein ACRDDY_14065 [Clostridium sp.]|uniref:hypothetical protein n=1 Tax=Clostridium sp. TaxID=1506 RepID=UPI003EE74384
MNRVQVPTYGKEINPKSKARKVQISVDFQDKSLASFTFYWDTFTILVEKPDHATTCPVLKEIFAMYRTGMELPFIPTSRDSLLIANEKAATVCTILSNYKFSAKMIK